MTSSNLLLRYVFNCTYPFSKIMNKLTSPLTSVPEAYLRGCILGYQFSSVQRDGMGREVGGRFGMGYPCSPVADSCLCLENPPQYCKVISLQLKKFSSVQLLSRVLLCDPMNHSMPGLPVHHKLPEFTQTHAHRVSDAIQQSHPLSSPSPPDPQPLPASGSFPMSQLFPSGGQSTGVSASTSVLPMNTQD